MIFISRKKFEREVQERAEQEIKKFYEARYQEDQARELHKRMDYMVDRLIVCEKKCGIDHPSHHRGDTCCPGY